MASFGGFGFTLTDIIIILSFILVAFFYYYNKSLKAVPVTARMFYHNHSSEDLPSKEIFDENRLEVTVSQGGGGLLSRNSNKNNKTISYELVGLPSEHRLGATKRSRIYYVRQGGTETISFMSIDTDTGDPIKQIILQTSAQVRAAQQAMHQAENRGLKSYLPGIFIGSGMTFGILYFIRLAFPSLVF